MEGTNYPVIKDFEMVKGIREKRRDTYGNKREYL